MDKLLFQKNIIRRIQRHFNSGILAEKGGDCRPAKSVIDFSRLMDARPINTLSEQDGAWSKRRFGDRLRLCVGNQRDEPAEEHYNHKARSHRRTLAKTLPSEPEQHFGEGHKQTAASWRGPVCMAATVIRRRA